MAVPTRYSWKNMKTARTSVMISAKTSRPMKIG